MADVQLSTLGSVIKTAYEGQADTNAFTDAEQSKLAGIATGATANSSDTTLLDRANHTGSQAQSTVTNLVTDLAAKAPLASPTLTGIPAAPTAAPGTNTTQIATTAFVEAKGAAIEGTAIKSTGEVGGTKFLREDGDGTCSWQTIAGGGDALVANPLSQFAATTSAQLAGVISDETGSGALVFATSPTFVTPTLGAATATSITIGSTVFDGTVLADPGADRGLGWDDSAGSATYWTPGTGLSFDGSFNLNAEVSLAGSQTLTNKTLTDPKITLTINAQTGTTYTLALTDAHKKVTMSNASANTLTIPANAAVAFPVGTIIGVTMLGAGTTTVDGDTGVTVNGVSAGGAAISAQYTGVTLTKLATDTWLMEGNHGTVA